MPRYMSVKHATFTLNLIQPIVLILETLVDVGDDILAIVVYPY